MTSFPLLSDHAVAASLSPADAAAYLRGALPIDGLAVAGAVLVTVRDVDKSSINRIRRNATPRASEAGRRVAARLSHTEDFNAAVDALSEAEHAAYLGHLEHINAANYAVCAASIASIRLDCGSTVREVLSATADDFESMFAGPLYPARFVLNRILIPAWVIEAQRVAAAAEDATARRDAALVELASATNADTLPALRDAVAAYQAARHLEAIAGQPDPETRAVAESVWLECSPPDGARVAWDAALVAADDAARARWAGADDPDAVAAEIAGHVTRLAMRPLAPMRYPNG